MLNLYPVRATDFKNLPAKVDMAAFTENLKCIESVVAGEIRPIVWAAWGESILHHPFFVEACVELSASLRRHEVAWQRFGDMTLSGHPRHPSRARYAWSFTPFDVESYVLTLRQ
jgi:hypothetical protein